MECSQKPAVGTPCRRTLSLLVRFLPLTPLLFSPYPAGPLSLSHSGGTLNEAVFHYLKNPLSRWLPKSQGTLASNRIAILSKMAACSPGQEIIIPQWAPASLKKCHSATPSPTPAYSQAMDSNKSVKKALTLLFIRVSGGYCVDFPSITWKNNSNDNSVTEEANSWHWTSELNELYSRNNTGLPCQEIKKKKKTFFLWILSLLVKRRNIWMSFLLRGSIVKIHWPGTSMAVICGKALSAYVAWEKPILLLLSQQDIFSGWKNPSSKERMFQRAAAQSHNLHPNILNWSQVLVGCLSSLCNQRSQKVWRAINSHFTWRFQSWNQEKDTQFAWIY